MYTSKWLFKWTKWWATMGIVGCSLFGSRYLRSALNVQFHAPPPSELSSHALCVSSRSSPFVVSHHQHHRHHHHHHSTCNSDFSTSICPVPNGAMKATGSSIHRYRKSDFGGHNFVINGCELKDLVGVLLAANVPGFREQGLQINLAWLRTWCLDSQKHKTNQVHDSN